MAFVPDEAAVVADQAFDRLAEETAESIPLLSP